MSSPASFALLIAAVVAADMTAHLRLEPRTAWEPWEPTSDGLRRLEQLPPGLFSPAGRRSDLGTHRAHLIPRIPVVEGVVSLSSPFNQLAAGRFRSVLIQHRYWLSPVAWEAPPRDVGMMLLAGLDAASKIPVLTSSVDALAGMGLGDPVIPGTFGSVSITSYLDDEVVLQAVVPPPAGAILVSTERYAPSWEATIDGVPSDVLVVNYFFRGLRVPPGAHVVRFRYRPAWFAPILGVGWITLLASGVAGALLLRRGKWSRARAVGIANARAFGECDGGS